MKSLRSKGLCDIWYASETHFKLKSRANSIVHHISFSCHIIAKFCTERNNIIAVLCVKFRNDWVPEKWYMSTRGFTMFVFKTSFRRISYIVNNLYTLLDRITNAVIPSFTNENINPSILICLKCTRFCGAFKIYPPVYRKCKDCTSKLFCLKT